MISCLRAAYRVTPTVALLGTFLACGDRPHAPDGVSMGSHRENLEVAEGSPPAAIDADIDHTATPPGAAAANRAEASDHAYMFACAQDSDCIAVPKAGLCRNGVKEAINRHHAEAYKQTFSKLRRGPCTFLLIRDRRVATCDKQAGRCILVVQHEKPRLPAVFAPDASPR